MTPGSGTKETIPTGSPAVGRGSLAFPDMEEEEKKEEWESERRNSKLRSARGALTQGERGPESVLE